MTGWRVTVDLKAATKDEAMAQVRDVMQRSPWAWYWHDLRTIEDEGSGQEGPQASGTRARGAGGER